MLWRLNKLHWNQNSTRDAWKWPMYPIGLVQQVLISSCNKTFCNFASFSFRAFFIDNILSSQREFRSSDMHPFVGIGIELLEMFLNLSCLVWKFTRLKTVKPFSGVYLLSDGSSWPFHCKIKTPEFAYSAAWTRLADFSSDTIANIGRNWIRGNKIQMNLGTLDVVFYKKIAKAYRESCKGQKPCE